MSALATSRRRRRWRLIVLLGLGLAVAACSLKFGYQHADWLVLWKIDQYFDLSREQKNVLAGQLKSHLVRHQKDTLPGYITFLSQVRDRARERITREDMRWALATYQRLRAEFFEGFVADGTAFLVSVDDEQVRHLEQRFQQDNKKAERLLQESVRERLVERAEETLDLLRDWLGHLSVEQEARVMQWSLALPETKEIRLNFQRERQRALLQLLRTSPRDREAITQGLQDWVVFPERHESAVFRSGIEQAQFAVIEMVLAIDRMITRRQRDHALKKLQELIDELQGLTMS